MQTQESETQTPPRENIFDLDGSTVETREAGAPPSVDNPPPAPKFKIGDREFATEKEAIEFAQSHVSTLETEKQVTDAYRQGIRDAMTQAPPVAPGVTPPPPVIVPELDATKLYENPQAFLSDFAKKIKTETVNEFQQQQNVQQESNRIWNEFSGRHPQLADFRNEIEGFVAQNQTDVRSIIAVKGKDAAYDYIATKVKSRFNSYAEALKPKRELPNKTETTPPSDRETPPVTPPKDKKNPSSFAEQLRSIRKR